MDPCLVQGMDYLAVFRDGSDSQLWIIAGYTPIGFGDMEVYFMVSVVIYGDIKGWDPWKCDMGDGLIKCVLSCYTGVQA